MNKKVIRSFIKEFTAYVNDEPVLMGYPASMTNRSLVWRLVTDMTDWNSLDAVFLSDDEYTDIKKAYYEGRLEDLEYFNNLWNNWQDYKEYYNRKALEKGTEVGFIDKHPLTRPQMFRLKA